MRNIQVCYEISKEDYEKALKEGAYCLISESIICGYGAYGARVNQIEGKYYLSYMRGDSCD